MIIPIIRAIVIIAIIAVILFTAYKIYEDPDIVNLKDPDEVSNKELSEKYLDVLERGFNKLKESIPAERLWSSAIIGLLILVAIYFGLELRRKKKSEKSPLEVLKERYAKGEISKEEFEAKKKNLE